MLTQVNDMVTDLDSMKSSGKLTSEQLTQVAQLLTKAAGLKGQLQNVGSGFDPLQVPQLASDLADLQKQIGALKALVQ
jgi:hypothetical protein